jgi:hypothetical protein
VVASLNTRGGEGVPATCEDGTAKSAGAAGTARTDEWGSWWYSWPGPVPVAQFTD